MKTTPAVLSTRPRTGIVWAYVLPFAIYIAFLAATPLLSWLDGHGISVSAFDTRWLYAVQVGCVTAALWWFIREYDELRNLHALTALQWLASIACGVVVFALWINLDGGWMSVGEGAGFNATHNDGTLHWPLIGVRLAGAALVVPVMEELFWRAFVMRWIADADFRSVDPARVGAKALLISAVVFGLEHQLWLAGIIAGAAYGWLYVYSRNLWMPIIAHATTNAALGIWVVSQREWRFW
jgi:uncharacterized protein